MQTIRRKTSIIMVAADYGGGGAPDNFAGWMMNWNDTDARSADNQAVINRIAEQCYGRPWTRMAPPLVCLPRRLPTR